MKNNYEAKEENNYTAKRETLHEELGLAKICLLGATIPIAITASVLASAVGTTVGIPLICLSQKYYSTSNK